MVHEPATDPAAPVNADERFDALIVSSLPNVRYLTGFSGSHAMCVVGPDTRILLTDARYLTQAAAEAPTWRVLDAGRDLLPAIKDIFTSSVRLAFEEDHLTVYERGMLEAHNSSNATLIPVSDVVEQLRAFKRPSELATLRAASRAAEGAAHKVLREDLVGMTRLELGLRLEREIAAQGAAVAFQAIITVDTPRQRQYAQSPDQRIGASSLVTIECGAVIDGYKSYAAYTILLGRHDAEVLTAAAATDEAADAMIARLVPGTQVSDVFAVGERALAARGCKIAQGPIGHGIGLQLEEQPWVTKDASGAVAENQVVVVRPVASLDDGREIVRGEMVHVAGERPHRWNSESRAAP